MTEYIEKLLSTYLPSMLRNNGVCIPDDAEELNWRGFFAHSQDMQGFRADIFTGGPNEEDNPSDPTYQGLRDRWPDSRTMINGLADLWADEASKTELTVVSNRTKRIPDALPRAIAVLRGGASSPATQTFADALDALRGYRVARKSAAMVRAYVENSARLRENGGGFREYLYGLAPEFAAGAADVPAVERRWKAALLAFYNVGPALADYLICDWLLGLWRGGQIDWFECYKADSVFIRTLAEEGKLPQEAGRDFVAYSRSIAVRGEWLPSGYEHLEGKPLPPRLLNEAIWLRENTHAKPE